MKNLIQYILILRPINFTIAFLSIYVAVIIGDKSLAFTLKAFLGALAGAIIGGAGMVINDYFDIEIDRVNRPYRPLPSGKISPKVTLIYYIILNLISILLASFTNIYAFVIALISIILVFFYSYFLKQRGLIGNFVVGFMTGLAFIYGGVISENVVPLIFPFVLGLLINFAREILKDIEDIEGDLKNNLKTFPIVYGEKKAINIFVILIGLTIISSMIPYFAGVYNIYYLLIITFGVNLPLIYTTKVILNNPTKVQIGKISNFIKYEMFVGLIAIYIGVS